MNNIINYQYAYSMNRNLSSAERLSFVFNPVSRPLNPWKEEVYNTARIIASGTTKPLMISMSGGIDAEVVARAFLDQQIPFEVFSIRYVKDANKYDIQFAIDFCKKYNIVHHIHEIDPVELWVHKINTYIDKGYRAVGIFRYLQLYILETIEGMGYTAVLGSGDQMYKTVDGQVCVSNITPAHNLAVQWCEDNNTLHYPYFFMQNPEVYASYMQIDLIDLKLNNPEWFVSVWHNASLEKQDVYHRFWPDMKRRSKTDGYKNIHGWKLKRELELYAIFPDIVPVYIPVETIKRQLGINGVGDRT